MEETKVVRAPAEISYAEAMLYLRGEHPQQREVWSYESWSGIEPHNGEICLVVGGFIELVKLGAPKRDEDGEQWTWKTLLAYKDEWVEKFYFHFQHNGKAEVL